MDESDYWKRLEYRVCNELRGLRHTEPRCYWCDGLVPSRYILDGPSPQILGHAWMGIGSRSQEQWEFTLRLERPVWLIQEFDWSALLPPEDMTRWLTIDPSDKQLVIEPSAAVPDSAPRVRQNKLGNMDRPT